jgi:UPF0755 protein
MARGRHRRPGRSTTFETVWAPESYVELEDPTDPGGSAPNGLVTGSADEPAPVQAPATSGRRRPAFWVFLFVLVGLIGVVGAAAVWALRQIDPPGPPGAQVTLDIPEGLSDGQIATLLAAKGVVTSKSVFEFYLRVRSPGEVPEGKYTFRKRQPMSAVVGVLRGGPKIVTYNLTLPEGLTISQIAAKVGEIPGLSEDRFLEALASGRVRSQYMPADAGSLEGFLFPDTYEIREGETEVQVLSRLVRRFDEVAAEVGIANVPGRTPYQVVIIASMVEREAGVDADRPKIARVIENRLVKGMPLQIDATLLYTKPPGSTVTGADLKTDGPYNTYTRKGLPPGPIANPGRASLAAAVNPEPGPWLFYVLSDQSGAHAFTDNYDEFLRFKQEAKDKGLF